MNEKYQVERKKNFGMKHEFDFDDFIEIFGHFLFLDWTTRAQIVYPAGK